MCSIHWVNTPTCEKLCFKDHTKASSLRPIVPLQHYIQGIFYMYIQVPTCVCRFSTMTFCTTTQVHVTWNCQMAWSKLKISWYVVTNEEFSFVIRCHLLLRHTNTIQAHAKKANYLGFLSFQVLLLLSLWGKWTSHSVYRI